MCKNFFLKKQYLGQRLPTTLFCYSLRMCAHQPPHTRPYSQSCGRSSPRCCRWWSAWTSTPPGTTACVRSRPCWRWRWCRWSWCSRRRSSGPCCARRCRRPTRRWSRGPSAPVGGKTEKWRGGYCWLSLGLVCQSELWMCAMRSGVQQLV